MKQTGRRQGLEGDESEEKVGVGCGVNNNYIPSILRGVHERMLASSSPSWLHQVRQQRETCSKSGHGLLPLEGSAVLKGLFQLYPGAVPPAPAATSTLFFPSLPLTPHTHLFNPLPSRDLPYFPAIAKMHL